MNHVFSMVVHLSLNFLTIPHKYRKNMPLTSSRVYNCHRFVRQKEKHGMHHMRLFLIGYCTFISIAKVKVTSDISLLDIVRLILLLKYR